MTAFFSVVTKLHFSLTTYCNDPRRWTVSGEGVNEPKVVRRKLTVWQTLLGEAGEDQAKLQAG